MLQQYSTVEILALVPVTQRQLQVWDETGLVRAHHTGHVRVYSRSDVLRIRVIAALRHKGLSLHKIRHCLVSILEHMNGVTDGYLVTDGKKTRIVPEATLISCLTRWPGAVYVVEIPRD